MIFIALVRFQFHEGPIKTHARKATSLVRTEFQFHEGPIKTTIEESSVPNKFSVSIP